MDQRKRRKLLQEKLHETCSTLGFRHLAGEYFVRERGELVDVFFFQLTRTNNQYYITYGIDCPKLLPLLRNNEVLALSDLPKLLISNGRLESGFTYGCKHEEHIESSSKKVAAALEFEAEKWFAKFTTPLQLIKQYQVSEVGAEAPSVDLPPGKILRWCIYGLMLLGIGDKAGKEWLAPVVSAYKSRPKMSSQDKEWVRVIEESYP